MEPGGHFYIIAMILKEFLMEFLGREVELYWDFAFIYVDFSYLCKRFESKKRIDYEIENCSSGR